MAEIVQNRQGKCLNLPLIFVIEVEFKRGRWNKATQFHTDFKVEFYAAFDAHPANFYYHATELYQTTACIFSNEI